MIIKIDHIAFNGQNFDENISFFTQKGYSLIIKEEELENIQIKKDYLENFHKKHNLALLEKPNSFSIEVLTHHSTTNQNGYIEPIFEADGTMDKIEISSNDIKQSKMFWSNLGFKETETPEEMSFFSILDRKNYLIKLKKSENKHHFLDDEGYNCIAFITNSAEKERQNLIKKGFAPSNIEKLCVNNNNMKIFFIQNNNNELVERIEREKNNATNL